MFRWNDEDWHTVIETNVSSVFHMCRAVIDNMRERGFGRVVNMSSINGQRGRRGQANYSAAKAGMIGLTKALALEFSSLPTPPDSSRALRSPSTVGPT